MRLRGLQLALVLAGASLVSALPAAASPVAAATTCTAAQKAKRVAGLTAFKHRLTPERRAYFRKVKSAKLRAGFVKRQQQRLKALQAAAACTVLVEQTPPRPSGPTYVFGAGVSAADRATVQSATELAMTYLRKLGASPPAFDVVVQSDLAELLPLYVAKTGARPEDAPEHWRSSTAIAFRGAFFLYTQSRGWAEMPTAVKPKVLVHELFHVVQWELVAPGSMYDVPADQVARSGPRWLAEGAAELIAFSALADAGTYDFSRAHGEQTVGAKRTAEPLRALETWPGMARAAGAAYSLSFVAVHLLTRDRGLHSLIAFWTAIGKGVAWPVAFADAFGRSVEQFYAEFEAYRLGL